MATEYSSTAVHIAIGVLMELHDCDPPQAIALLSSAAFRAGRTITDLALEIIDDPRHTGLVILTGDFLSTARRFPQQRPPGRG